MARIVLAPQRLAPLAELALLEGRVPTDKEWKTWVLETAAVFVHEDIKVQVPKGFMTDFASIPWFFRWWQTGSVGPQRVAAYFHDWLYSEQSALTRKQSDRVYRLAMLAASDPTVRNWLRRWAMYAGLRIGGFLAWRSNQKSLRELGPGWRVLE
jgi:hypothetical protein